MNPQPAGSERPAIERMSRPNPDVDAEAVPPTRPSGTHIQGYPEPVPAAIRGRNDWNSQLESAWTGFTFIAARRSEWNTSFTKQKDRGHFPMNTTITPTNSTPVAACVFLYLRIRHVINATTSGPEIPGAPPQQQPGEMRRSGDRLHPR
jgi:hypothetical protein